MKGDINLAKQHSRNVKGMVTGINSMIQSGNVLEGTPKTGLPDIGMVDYSQLEQDLSMKLLDMIATVSGQAADDVLTWMGQGSDYVVLASRWQKEGGNAKDAVKIVEEMRKGMAGGPGVEEFEYDGKLYNLTGTRAWWKKAMELDYSGTEFIGKDEDEIIQGRYVQRIMETLDEIYSRGDKIKLVREWMVTHPDEVTDIENLTEEQMQDLEFFKSIE